MKTKLITGVLLALFLASILVQSKTTAVSMYYLTVRTNPPGIAPIAGEGWHAEGTIISLTAPDTADGYQFDYWEVNGIMMPGNPIFITMDGNKTAIAYYKLQPPIFIAHFMTPEGEPYPFDLIISNGTWRKEWKNVTYIETEVPLDRVTYTMTYTIDDTVNMHQFLLERSLGSVTEVEFYVHHPDSVPSFTPIVFAKEIGATINVSSNYDPSTGVLNIAADIQPPEKFGRLVYYLDKSSLELPQYFLEEYTLDGVNYTVENCYGPGSEDIPVSALIDIETSSGNTRDISASLDLIIVSYKHTWTWNSSVVGVSGVIYKGSIIRPFDLSLEKIGGQRRGIEFLWPQFHVPHGEEGCYVLHIEDLPEEYVELDLPIYVSSNSCCLPQLYLPKESELEAYTFGVTGEEYMNAASYSNLTHDEDNKTLTVDVSTGTNYDWWGYFALPRDWMVRTLTAYSGNTSYQLSKFYNYTYNLAGDYNIITCRIPPEMDGLNLTYTIQGDIDGDYDVDLYDAVRLLTHYGAKMGSPAYDADCDLNCDGRIDLYDAVMLLVNYGKKDP